jgi:hypothetical protein
MRAKIVLLASQGFGNDCIAARLGMPRQIVSKWRQRSITSGCRPRRAAAGSVEMPPGSSSAPCGITEAAHRYLAPLIIGESCPPFKAGLPDYVKLQNVVVPKKLASTFTIPALATAGS